MLEGIYWYDFSGAASLLTLLLATLRLLGVQVCGEGSVTKPLRLTKKFPLWCHPPPHIPKKIQCWDRHCPLDVKKIIFFSDQKSAAQEFWLRIKSMSFGHWDVHRDGFRTLDGLNVRNNAQKTGAKAFLVPNAAHQKISGLPKEQSKIDHFWYVKWMGGGGNGHLTFLHPPPCM